MTASLGVSVVICCHNSAQRLPRTLAHLSAQKVSAEIPWEVIVVDNASSDDTAKVEASSWPKNARASLSVLREPEPGLSHARRRGFDEAKYEIVCFIDDDNWVSTDWVETISRVMSEHPDVGACGGFAEAACDSS